MGNTQPSMACAQQMGIAGASGKGRKTPLNNDLNDLKGKRRLLKSPAFGACHGMSADAIDAERFS
jgi:hypothetical protein